VAVFLQAVEEGEHAIGIERGDGQRDRFDAGLPMDELQQQSERIAIARDRLETETFLRHKILREEHLQQRSHEDRRHHWAPPSWPSASTSSAVGPALYSGGAFSSAGGVVFNNLAKWNGTQWSALGGGAGSASAFSLVNAVTDFDDGTGPALYAGGIFNTAGGAPGNNIARWRCTP